MTAQAPGVPERTLRDFLEAVFRHKTRAALFLLAVVATAAGVLAFTPGTYTSTAKLMVRRGREGVVLNPAASAGDSLPLYKEWENEINTELEILGSRELVIEVVQSLGEEAFLAPPPPSSGLLSPVRAVLNPFRRLAAKCRSLIPKRDAGPESGGGQAQLDKAVRIVEKNLMIEARKKSDIITVSYTANNPELARQVVTQLVSIYLDRRIDVHKVLGAHQFFSQQTEKLMRDLKATEQSITSIKSSAGISSLEDSRSALQLTIGTIQTQQIQNESSLAAADARVATLRSMLTQQETPDSGSKSSALLDRTEYQALQSTLRREEIAQSSLRAEAQKLTQRLAQLRKELADMNALDVPIRKLQREQELLEEKYRKYSEDQEQARINDELETKKISNVSIVQQATLPGEANPSGKLFKLFAAAFLGLIGAVAISLAADFLDPTLHSAADVSGRLHLPVLVELPLLRNSDLYSFIHPSARSGNAGARFKGVDNCFQELLFKILALRAPAKSSPFVIGITSSSAGEGVSSMAVHLSAAFARDDRFSRTLLLDATVKKPFDDPAERLGDAPFTYVHMSGNQEGGESAELPGGVTLFMERLSQLKKQEYDVIVVDLPPVSQGGSTIRMASALDFIILVVEAGHIPWRTVLRTSGLLDDAGAALRGVILNRRYFSIPGWLYRKL